MKSRMKPITVTAGAELIDDAHIYTKPILNLILDALLQSSFLSSEQNKPRLNNDDVMKLAASCLSESVVVRVIEVYKADFDTSSTGLLRLRKNGVGERVIETMLLKKFETTASGDSATAQHPAT